MRPGGRIQVTTTLDGKVAMETLPLHPKLVHLPIALAALMPLISVGLLIAWWRGALARRTWVVAVALQAILVASGIAAIQTGGEDEERVERVVPEAAIEAHEEAAETMVWAAGAVLVLAGAALLAREQAARGLAAATVVGTVLVLLLGVRTGEAGGRLVYQHGAAAAFAPVDPTAGGPPPARGDDDDDDD